MIDGLISGPQANVAVGAVVALVGLMSWSAVLIFSPHRYVLSAPVMVMLATGMLLVSGLSLAHEPWLVSVVAAINRTLVAGAGVRALWIVTRDARDAASRES